jgi:hypothetical protein
MTQNQIDWDDTLGKELNEIPWLENDPLSKTLLEPVYNYRPSKDEPPDILRIRRTLAIIPLRITEHFIEDNQEQTFTLADKTLLARQANFASRTQFYFTLFNWWQHHLQNQQSPKFINEVNYINLFAPLYAQQLEGPLRFELAVFIDIIKSYVDGYGNWHEILYNRGPNDEPQYVSNMLNMASQQAARIEDELVHILLKLGIDWIRQGLPDEWFDEEQISISEFRNAIAHSDYYLDREDGKVQVIFNLSNHTLIKSVLNIIHILHSQLLLMSSLEIGVNASLFRAGVVNKNIIESFDIVSAYEEGIHRLLRSMKI